MAQARVLWLPAALRQAGVRVVETPRWATRSRPEATGGFAPRGVLIHHTATGHPDTKAPSLRIVTEGRADLPGPLAQVLIDRDGVAYIVAAGRSNHAGKARASGPMPAGDGNVTYIGLECENTGRGEPWPAVQVTAMVSAAAAIELRLGGTAEYVRGHKETSTAGKIDPSGIDMAVFRARVRQRMVELSAPPKPAPPKPASPKPAPPTPTEDTMTPDQVRALARDELHRVLADEAAIENDDGAGLIARDRALYRAYSQARSARILIARVAAHLGVRTDPSTGQSSEAPGVLAEGAPPK